RFQRDAAGVRGPALAADLGVADSKLGNLNERMGRTAKALDADEKSCSGLENIVDRGPGKTQYARHLVLPGNKAGLLMAKNGQTKAGLALLRKAIELQTNMIVSQPESAELSNELATAHSNLGFVLMQMGARSEASDEFATAIGIQEPLANIAAPNEA